MNRLLLSLSLLLTAQAHAEPVLQNVDLKGLSRNTQSILERYETCLHLAGEFSGEPALDVYVKQQMKKFRCSQIDRDVSRLRHRSYQNMKVVNALKKIEAEYDISR